MVDENLAMFYPNGHNLVEHLNVHEPSESFSGRLKLFKTTQMVFRWSTKIWPWLIQMVTIFVDH